MLYRYHFTDHFRKQVRKHSKKYRGLKQDIRDALTEFDKRRSEPLGASLYKVRVKSRDIPRGKSHAFRMIILAYEFKTFITPVVIYFKGDKANIDKEELFYHLAIVKKELEKELGIL